MTIYYIPKIFFFPTPSPQHSKLKEYQVNVTVAYCASTNLLNKNDFRYSLESVKIPRMCMNTVFKMI